MRRGMLSAGQALMHGRRVRAPRGGRKGIAMTMIRVTVWGENIHDRTDERVRAMYPQGMHETIAGALREALGPGATVRTATLDQPDHGLTDAVLESTDVLTWWGHAGHHLVSDEGVANVQRRGPSRAGWRASDTGATPRPVSYVRAA